MFKSRCHIALSIIGLFLTVILLVGCGKTIYKEKKPLVNDHGEFYFNLEPSEKKHKLYFTYHYKGGSFYLEGNAKLFLPDGTIKTSRIINSQKSQGTLYYHGLEHVATFTPNDGGKYKLIVDIIRPKKTLTDTGIKIKK